MFAVFFVGGWAISIAPSDEDLGYFVTTASAAPGALVGPARPEPGAHRQQLTAARAYAAAGWPTASM